ncbi:MAG: PQQ-like beta-propeller repeat protein, partial [Planctomycetaceae bacterium]|nr:PQQ-like beta-propeller repeat protein [Planctomycetaceae bacterium]
MNWLRSLVRRSVILIACIGALLGFGSTVLAQFQIDPPADSGDSLSPELRSHLGRLPADGETFFYFQRGLSAIDSGELAQGMETLQQIRAENSDFFLYNQTGITGTLYATIEKIFAEHQVDYERLYGTAAEQMLNEAVENQDVPLLMEVSRQFAMTGAGRRALELLAAEFQSQGDLGRAAQIQSRLAKHPLSQSRSEHARQAGTLALADGAPLVARNLVATTPGLAAEDVNEIVDQLKTPDQKDSLASDMVIRNWSLPSGNLLQAGQGATVPAMTPEAWSAPLINEYDFLQTFFDEEVRERLLKSAQDVYSAARRRARSESDRVLFPTGRPLVIGSEVIVAGPGTVKSFDLETGQHRWTSCLIDGTFSYLHSNSASLSEQSDPVRETMRNVVSEIRSFRDLTSATLSSDGRYVYALTNCQPIGTTSEENISRNRQPHDLIPQRRNLLIQLSLEDEGLVRGWLGTPSDEQRDPFGESESREIFFMGPPIEIDGTLFAIGEEQGQIQLFAIDPDTFSISWTIGLLNPVGDLTTDYSRRISGLMPVYGGGRLICPTGEGVIVAVDPGTRMLAWTHQYKSYEQEFLRFGRRIRFNGQDFELKQAAEELLQDDRWFDFRMIVSGDYVACTPTDHDHFVVLNLFDGQPAWQEPFPRGSRVALAGTYQDQWILVARRSILAVRAADGSMAWNEPVPISLPSGRGIRMGSQFLQPLASGEIGVIDLEKGRLITRISSSAEIPGNLAVGGDRLILQTANAVRSYLPSSDIQQLADAETPNARAELALWDLQRGRVDEGIAALREILTGESPAEYRRALVATMIDGLRIDFEKYRHLAEEVSRLAPSSDQHREFLRAYSRGLISSGEFVEATKHSLNLLTASMNRQHDLREGEDELAISDYQWSLGVIREILETRSPQDGECRDLIKGWLNDQESPGGVLQVVNALPQMFLSPEERFHLLDDAATDRNSALVQETLLVELLNSPDPSIQAEAMRRLVLMNLEFRSADAANELMEQLSTRYDNVAFPSGELPSEFVKTTRQVPKWSEVLNLAANWPRSISLSDSKELSKSL